MTPREVVQRTIRFEGAERLPYDLPEPHGSDFYHVSMWPSPDSRPGSGPDEWGSLWHNIGISRHGEVKQPVLADWSQWDSLKIPDIRDSERWHHLEQARATAGDKFLLGTGISLYERSTLFVKFHYRQGGGTMS